MPEPISTALILSALGLAKGVGVDMPREKRQRKLAAETQRYSPWTGMQAAPVEEASPLNSALQYGGKGFALGQNIEQAEAAKEMQAIRKQLLQKKLAGWGNPSMDLSDELKALEG